MNRISPDPSVGKILFDSILPTWIWIIFPEIQKKLLYWYDTVLKICPRSTGILKTNFKGFFGDKLDFRSSLRPEIEESVPPERLHSLRFSDKCWHNVNILKGTCDFLIITINLSSHFRRKSKKEDFKKFQNFQNK
jgi:hypothetical protein